MSNREWLIASLETAFWIVVAIALLVGVVFLIALATHRGWQAA